MVGTNQLVISWKSRDDVCYALAKMEDVHRQIELALYSQKGTDWELIDRYRKKIHDLTE